MYNSELIGCGSEISDKFHFSAERFVGTKLAMVSCGTRKMVPIKKRAGSFHPALLSCLLSCSFIF